MKEFRKTEDGLFICEECGKTFKSKVSLSTHISAQHCNKKEYFDKWLKDKNEEFCKNCGKPAKFYGLNGYKSFCCKKCADKLKYEKVKISNLKKYGVENPFQVKIFKQKAKQTKKEKYGNENYNNMEKHKQTCLEKYGVENASQSLEIKEKKIKTCLKNHGVEHPFQSDEILEKSKKTCKEKYGVEFNSQRKDIQKDIQEKIVQTNLEKYGVERPAQNKEIFEKSCKTGHKLKRFRDTNLFYQGTYELDFLNKYYDLYPEIVRGEAFFYINDKGKDKVYFPDFYIKSLNLIIEIKSTWTYNEIIDTLKREAVLNKGYNYIMITNKDYSKITF